MGGPTSEGFWLGWKDFHCLVSAKFWIAVFSLLALVGCGFLLVAFVTGEARYVVVALILGAPLGLGAVFLGVLVIPYLIYCNIKSSGNPRVS